MHVDSEYTISEFGVSSATNLGPINFSHARKLERGGSTCDAYIAKYHNKTVFVKRLKPEFRSAPVYQAAFAKEFELGIALTHPALPNYRAIGEDYIVMDYIDGMTLADMISRRDKWLMNVDNVRGVLRSLVGVAGYLHSKNVLHSDIKVDNVMITTGTRNTVLIDLDKAYTFTHNTTPGDPEKYGLEENDHSNPAIDFNGIAGIVDRLTAAGFPTKAFRKFRKHCCSEVVTSDRLLKSLERDRRDILLIGGILLIMGVITIGVITHRPTDNVDIQHLIEKSAIRDSVATAAEASAESIQGNVTPITSAVVRSSDYESIINQELKGYFKSTEAKIKEAEALLALGTATDNELRDANLAITRANSIELQAAYKLYVTRFPEIAAGKVEYAVATSVPTHEIMERQSEMSKRITSEIMRRHPETYNTYEDSLYMGLVVE